jgi:oxygen-independent coproporphyrinogen-3 oxidase
MSETMILGLRLTQEGVSLPAFERRFGANPNEVFGNVIPNLKTLALLHEEDQRLRLTPQARLLGNQVFVRFLDRVAG